MFIHANYTINDIMKKRLHILNIYYFSFLYFFIVFIFNEKPVDDTNVFSIFNFEKTIKIYIYLQ